MKFSAAKSVFVILLVTAAIICVFGTRRGVDTDLFSMLGKCPSPVSSLANSQALRIRVLCRDEETAEKCRAVFQFDEPVDAEKTLELIRTHGAGLLSEKSRRLLEANETNRIARSALRRDYAGTGLFPPADDPYYFLNDFVLELQRFQPKVPEGAVFLTGRVPPSQYSSLAPLIELAEKDDGVALSGAPFHSYLATEKTKREINLVGVVSLISVIALGWWLFRRLNFLLVTLAALGGGFLLGSAALFAVYQRPHAVTFLFGTSLIGLGVDYCYHGLREKDDPGVIRNLTAALVTTVCAFLPLVFSSVAVLGQMSVFTIAGLLAVYLFTRIWVVYSR